MYSYFFAEYLLYTRDSTWPFFISTTINSSDNAEIMLTPIPILIIIINTNINSNVDRISTNFNFNSVRNN